MIFTFTKKYKKVLTYLSNYYIIILVDEHTSFNKPINFGPVAQLVRALPCHGRGRGFESLLGRFYGSIAQLGEHLPYKQRVIGSSPIVPILENYVSNSLFFRSKRKPTSITRKTYSAFGVWLFEVVRIEYFAKQSIHRQEVCR